MATYGKRSGSGSSAGSDGAPVFTGGLAIHSVRMVATSNVAALSGLQNFEGLTGAEGDRILLAAQSTGSQNGIYVMSSGAWTRATDFNDSTKVVPGSLIYVADGNVSGDSIWKLTTDGAITVGTTSLTFTNQVIGPSGTEGAPAVRLGASGGLYRDSNGQICVSFANNQTPFLVGSAVVRIGIGAVLQFQDSGTTINRDGTSGSLILKANKNVVVGAAGALADGATSGFLELPTCPGEPTGVVSPETGKAVNVLGNTGAIPTIYYRLGGGGWAVGSQGVSALKAGASLTDADQTLQPFTDKASRYDQVTALTANRTKTLGTTSVVAGTKVTIVRRDAAAFTLAVVNGGAGAGTLFTFAASPTEVQRATFTFDGTNWALGDFEYVLP